MGTRIQIFAKAPVPGAVKTRLIPKLGEVGAASLHALLIERAVHTALTSSVGPIELWCTPAPTHPAFAAFAGSRVTLRDQGPGDLGLRMYHALCDAHSRGDHAILIGSDCPALTCDDLRAAAAALTTGVDAVIVPAEDGGYVLIAILNPCLELFDQIPWGSDSVIAQTRSRMSHFGWRWHELPMRWDVDRPADYDRLVREKLIQEHPG